MSRYHPKSVSPKGVWLKTDVQKLRDMCSKKVPITSIAISLNRPVQAVLRVANRRGIEITEPDCILYEVSNHRSCLLMYSNGYSDNYIAEHLRVSSKTVQTWRRWHCFPANKSTDKVKKRHLNGIKSWLKEQDYSSIGELRVDHLRSQCANRGWPEIQHPSDCDILDLLLVKGPMTFAQICNELGLPVLPSSSVRPRRNLVRLTRMKMVTVEEIQRGNGKGGRPPYLYKLAEGVNRHQTKRHHRETNEHEPQFNNSRDQ